MDWKGIVEKTIIAVLAGTILAVGGLAYTRFFPGGQSISAMLTWVDLRNPLFSSDRKFIAEVDRLIQQQFGVSNATFYTDRLGSELRLGRIDFTNDTETRSEEIFVLIEAAALYSPDATDQAGSVRSALARS